MELVSDEVMEKARRAFAEHCLPVHQGAMRAALEAVADDMVRAERDACERLAGGWRCEASGDNYQTSGNGNFWDDDSIYGQGRTEAAAAIRARSQKTEPPK